MADGTYFSAQRPRLRVWYVPFRCKIKLNGLVYSYGVVSSSGSIDDFSHHGEALCSMKRLCSAVVIIARSSGQPWRFIFPGCRQRYIVQYCHRTSEQSRRRSKPSELEISSHHTTPTLRTVLLPGLGDQLIRLVALTSALLGTGNWKRIQIRFGRFLFMLECRSVFYEALEDPFTKPPTAKPSNTGSSCSPSDFSHLDPAPNSQS